MTQGRVRGLEVGFDAERGMVLCRVTGPFFDADAGELTRMLKEAIARGRESGGPLRVLWINTLTMALGPALSNMFRTLLVDQGRPTDRLAIVVSNNVEKARSRPLMAPGHQIFASENAALTWLSVGTSSAA